MTSYPLFGRLKLATKAVYRCSAFSQLLFHTKIRILRAKIGQKNYFLKSSIFWLYDVTNRAVAKTRTSEFFLKVDFSPSYDGM